MQALVDGVEQQLEFPRNSQKQPSEETSRQTRFSHVMRVRPTFKGRKRELHVTADRVKMKKSKKAWKVC